MSHKMLRPFIVKVRIRLLSPISQLIYIYFYYLYISVIISNCYTSCLTLFNKLLPIYLMLYVNICIIDIYKLM